MPVMHTAIPCTGNTADQAVRTVHLQLGAAKHLTRPLTADGREASPRSRDMTGTGCGDGGRVECGNLEKSGLIRGWA